MKKTSPKTSTAGSQNEEETMMRSMKTFDGVELLSETDLSLGKIIVLMNGLSLWQCLKISEYFELQLR